MVDNVRQSKLLDKFFIEGKNVSETWGRRSGKTTAIRRAIVQFLQDQENTVKIIWYNLNNCMAMEQIDPLVLAIQDAGMGVKLITKNYIKLENGSLVHVVPYTTSFDAFRGGKIDLICADDPDHYYDTKAEDYITVVKTALRDGARFISLDSGGN